MSLTFNINGMPHLCLSGFSTRFQALSRSLQAGCLCITHPFATRSGKQACLPSFDLHVLGTPPAFILSQDQTLHLTLALLSLSLRFSLNSLTLCVSSVQFSKISCSLSLNALCYNTTIRSCVNSFLQNFFSSLSLSLPLRRALYYLFIFPV